MTSATALCIYSPITPISRRRHWIQWALAISLILHGGAVLLVVYFSTISSAGNRSTNLTIQDIEFSQPPVPPLQPLAVPTEHNHIAASPAPPHVRESGPLIQEKSAETRPITADNTSNAGGLAETALGLGMAHGYFSMFADGKTLRDDVRVYYFELVEKINHEWWKKAGLLKEPLRADGIFEILIQRDGSIVSLHLVRGSGSTEADRLIADIIRNAAPLPPLPATYGMDQFNAPLRIKAPLSLFRIN